MKIALAAPAIYPARGGVELHVHGLARSLAALGHEVHVFTGAGPVGESSGFGYRVSRGVGLTALPSALCHQGFDVVHAHGARTLFAAGALVAGKAGGLHTVFTPHCFYPAQDWSGRIKRALFDPSLGRLALRCSDHVICLTANDQNDALACGAARESIQLIPNSISLPELPAEVQVAEFRRRRNWGKFLLSVGRLDRVKGGDFLIAALPHLPPDLHLVFVGPDRGCLGLWRRQAEDMGLAARVHFLLDAPDAELHLAYQASLALVMASAYEGLPTVLLEAMALRTPVIAAATGGIGWLLQNGVNGLLYPFGDLRGFCAQVRLCLEGAPEEMLDQAWECVRQGYSWNVNAPRIAALYNGHVS